MAQKTFAFPKNRRLILPAEFESVRKNGQVQRGKLMMLSVLAVEQEKTFRAGFVTSRKIGSAVVRNIFCKLSTRTVSGAAAGSASSALRVVTRGAEQATILCLTLRIRACD